MKCADLSDDLSKYEFIVSTKDAKGRIELPALALNPERNNVIELTKDMMKKRTFGDNQVECVAPAEVHGWTIKGKTKAGEDWSECIDTDTKFEHTLDRFDEEDKANAQGDKYQFKKHQEEGVLCVLKGFRDITRFTATAVCEHRLNKELDYCYVGVNIFTLIEQWKDKSEEHGLYRIATAER